MSPVKKPKALEEDNLEVFRGCHHLLIAFTVYGIDIIPLNSRKKFFTYIIVLVKILLGLLFHFLYVDYIFMIFKYGMEYEGVVKALGAYGLTATSILILWHIMRMKRKEILTVLQEIFLSTQQVSFGKICGISIVNGITQLIFAFAVVSTVAMVYFMIIEDDRFYTFYYYSNRVNNFTWMEYSYLFCKYFGRSYLLQVYTGLVTHLYCIVCYRAFSKLRHYRHSFSRLKHMTDLTPYFSILRGYIQFLDIISEAEAVFSKIAFFLVVSNFLSAFTILATTFNYSKEYVTVATHAISIITFLTSGFSLILTISFASQVSLEMSRNSRLFHLLLDGWKCNGQALSSEFESLAEAIKTRPNLRLSGCEVFYFNRNGILAVFGTLLTYGLLILQLKSSPNSAG